MADGTLDARQRERLRASFEAEERRGLQLGVRARLGANTIVALWFLISMEAPRVYYYLGLMAAFCGLALLWLLLSRGVVRAPWAKYAIATAEMALLAWAIVVPPPLGDWPSPPTIVYYGSAFAYFFVVLSAMVFAYSPRLVRVAGSAAALFWALAAAWVAHQPGVTAALEAPDITRMTPEALLGVIYDPRYLSLGARVEEVLTILIVTGVLAVATWRVRRVVRRQARMERERGNLARYFAPTMVDALSRADRPFATERRQDAAVLFADIVGFTGLVERMEPEAVIGFLRDYHTQMEQAIFEHGGTLDKYLGDGLMATFGTPERGRQDASDAVRAALAMQKRLGEWNGQWDRALGSPIHMGVGIHFGPVVLGDVGSERRLEFAVIGDTVNVAARLEALTRELGCAIVISDAAADEVRREVCDWLLEGFRKADSTWPIKGRADPVAVWTWGAIDGNRPEPANAPASLRNPGARAEPPA